MLPEINVGDEILHPQVFRAGDHAWQRHYEVLKVEPVSMRFGKPDVIVHVKITCISLNSDKRNVIDACTRRWLSQIAQGF